MSMATDVERQFGEFQRTGSPRAIAAVYDELAPDLALLASRVGPRGADSEDLVQQTFLTAIEHAADYDRDRPLLPWLVGILVNQARTERRARRRRPDPDRLDSSGGPPDPAVTAERAELRDQVGRILHGLPENYRDTLSLRWEQGFAPVEIAERLGVSRQTVKTRLRRGRELLRQALPAGFATASVAALLSPSSALAAGRAAVVQRARELQAATAVGGSSFAVLAKATWCGAAAIVTIAVWMLVAGSVHGDARIAPAALASVPGESVRETDVPARAGVGMVQRSVVEEAVREHAVLRTRVRWADGTPAVGVWVSALRIGGANPRLTEQWEKTDARGVVRFVGLEHGRFRLATARGGGIEVTKSSARSRTLTIPAGFTVRGRVHDDGTPLPNAVIWVTRGERGETGDDGHEAVRTDAHGEFELRSVAPGRGFAVLVDGYAPGFLQPVDEWEDRLVDVDLAPRRSERRVEGCVRGPGGEPIGGALVRVGAARHAPDEKGLLGELALVPPVTVRTAADGTFSCRSVDPAPHVRVWARAAGFGAWQGVSRRDPLDIVLDPAVRVWGRVHDCESEAVEGAELFAQSAVDGDGPSWIRSTTVSDRRGDFEMTVGSGVTKLTAVVGTRRAQWTCELHEDTHWQPVVSEPVPRRGRVVSSRGAGLPGLRVVAWSAARELAAVTTDEHGGFRLPDDDGEARRWTVVDPQRSWSAPLAMVRRAPDREEPGDIVIDASRLEHGAMRGRAVGPDGRPVDAGVLLSTLGPGAAYTRTDSSGRFVFDRLPAGRAYAIRVQSIDGELAAFADAHHVEAGETVKCGTVRMHRTGRLEARVTGPEGEPVALCSVAIEAAGRRLLIGDSAIQDGVLRSPRLPPGEYSAHVLGPSYAQSVLRFEVVAGKVTRRDWRLVRGRVVEFVHGLELGRDPVGIELHWLDASGEYRCGARMTVDAAWRGRTRQAFEPGRYRVLARCSDGRRAEAWFDVSQGGGAEPVVTLGFGR